MEKDFFINNVKEQHKREGNSMYYNNEVYIGEKIKTADNNVMCETNISNLTFGCFYFIFYDLQGKSSNMEKFNPILLVDEINKNNTKVYYTLNINFLPITVRVLFFNEILNASVDIIEENNPKKIINQEALNGINFDSIYNMLKAIGFEWALREIDIRKINNIYKVNTEYIDIFITMSTAKFTGVDDNKLVQIWQSKLKNRAEREQKLIDNIMNSYKNIRKTFNEQFNKFSESAKNIEKSIKDIKKI